MQQRKEEAGLSAGGAPISAADAQTGLEDLLAREALSIVFQPIVDLENAEIAGFEALARPDASTRFTTAGELFDAAEALGMLEEIEAVARQKSLAMAAARPDSGLLFLNNSPPVFTSPDFARTIWRDIAVAGGISAHRIVLEITERTGHDLISTLSHRAHELRERNFGVALDDVGAGISGLNQIMSLRPNWLKLDLELISNIHNDPLKQNLIRLFVRFATLANMHLVAEGIEQREELRVLIELGVTHGQGFYLARPGEIGAPLPRAIRDVIRELRHDADARKLIDPGSVRVGSLACPSPVCDQAEAVGEVRDRLLRTASHAGVVILDGRRFVSWLSRADVIDNLATVSPCTPIGHLPLPDVPLAPSDLALPEALELVATRGDTERGLPIVVGQSGQIVGVVSIRDLLLAAADVHRRAPSHIAPLTGLPSRVQADRWLASHMETGDPCTMAFIDLRDFGAYNRAYGYDRGDQMLMCLVGLLQTHLVEGRPAASFLAHIGEDRFLIALPRSCRGELIELSNAFQRLQGEFFSSEDIAAGHYHDQPSAGRQRVHPLTRLRIICLPEVLRRISSPRELYNLADSLRLRDHFNPATGGDPIVLDDRRQPAKAKKRKGA
ncbi:MAG: EAL domain-containing protein [Phycisphaerales bacterium]|nr:EAL domain-containing protein [Phycisphaerae bacterium]NNF43068.1 EAL domain-containing protein [Phycisphaerales bacterium]NNM25420.1 EAL domain-containing protein [Phycisphaerales bacterium]